MDEEFSARWGERIHLRLPTRAEAVELLRSGERSVSRQLGPLLEGLGMQIEVPVEVLVYVADHWLRTESDLRTAAELIVAAARRRIIEALERGTDSRLVLAPDDVVLDRMRRGRDP
jgi:hypothetical protein